MDQYNKDHLLPLYLCKVTNQDQSKIEFDEQGNAKRGLRTFGEIAHFVRCIPYKNHELFQSDNLWCSPDFVINIKAGTEEDHALLMASCFRTVKHEDQKEFDEFAKE